MTLKTKTLLVSLRILFFLSLWVITGCDSNQYPDINYREVLNYLKDNYENIDLSDPTDLKLRLFDSVELSENQLFLIGENHSVAINTEIEWFFTRFLHEHAGVDYLLQEVSFSHAEYENAYLKTGNILYIDTLFSQLRGTFSWTKERYNFLKKLYSYNCTQPAENKLSFIGVDIEHQDLTALRYISKLIDTATLSLDISDDLSKLIQLKTNGCNDSAALSQAVDAVKLSLKNFPDSYERYFGDKILNFKIVIENMINKRILHSIQDYKKYNQYRDSCIFENFIRVFPTLQPGRFFGQWGLNHVLQKEEGPFWFFAAYCNQDKRSPLRGKVVSIVNFYKNSYYLDRNSLQPVNWTTIDDHENLLEEIANGKLTIFKLDGPNSPFLEQLIWMPKDSYQNDVYGSTANYFQFFLFINNAGAAQPLE